MLLEFLVVSSRVGMHPVYGMLPAWGWLPLIGVCKFLVLGPARGCQHPFPGQAICWSEGSMLGITSKPAGRLNARF